LVYKSFEGSGGKWLSLTFSKKLSISLHAARFEISLSLVTMFFLGLIFFRLFVVGPRHYLSLMWQEGINHGGAKFRVRLVVEEV
jgi:hypothetical protein